jgi:hypothetical protein
MRIMRQLSAAWHGLICSWMPGLNMALAGFPRVFTTSETQQCKALKVDASIKVKWTILKMCKIVNPHLAHLCSTERPESWPARIGCALKDPNPHLVFLPEVV